MAGASEPEQTLTRLLLFRPLLGSMDVIPESQPSHHYEGVLLFEVCQQLVASDDAVIRSLHRPVQLICRIEAIDNYVNVAIAVDPENSQYRLPLATRLVSPLHGPASGLWRVLGVLHGGRAVRKDSTLLARARGLQCDTMH